MWCFAGATDLRPLMYWGAGTGFRLAVVGVVRVLLFMHVQTDRVIREVTRLELQVARLTARDAA